MCGKQATESLSTQAGGAGLGASAAGLRSLPCTGRSPRNATFPSRTCQALGFLHPSGAPKRLLLCRSCCLMRLELEKRTLQLFFSSFVSLSTRFYIRFLCTCSLACTLLCMGASLECLSVCSSQPRQREAGPTQPLRSTPTPVCGRLMAAMTPELQRAR